MVASFEGFQRADTLCSGPTAQRSILPLCRFPAVGDGAGKPLKRTGRRYVRRPLPPAGWQSRAEDRPAGSGSQAKVDLKRQKCCPLHNLSWRHAFGADKTSFATTATFRDTGGSRPCVRHQPIRYRQGPGQSLLHLHYGRGLMETKLDKIKNLYIAVDSGPVVGILSHAETGMAITTLWIRLSRCPDSLSNQQAISKVEFCQFSQVTVTGFPLPGYQIMVQPLDAPFSRFGRQLGQARNPRPYRWVQVRLRPAPISSGESIDTVSWHWHGNDGLNVQVQLYVFDFWRPGLCGQR